MVDKTQSYHHPIKDRVLKLVIVGDPNVGKTSLRRVFMGESFKQNYLPTLGADFSLFEMSYKTQRIRSTLWDLSGQPRFSKVHPQYYIGAHGAVVVYDLYTSDPVDNIINWIDTYLEYSGRFGGPLLIIQNKIDLADPIDEIASGKNHDKLVDQLQIYYTDKIKLVGARTSAKTNENVHTALENYICSTADFIEKNSQKPVYPGFSEKLISFVKPAYFMTFDNVVGPIFVAKSPHSENLEYSPEEEASVVHLSAGMSLDDLTESQYETGTFHWKDPNSVMYYIAFVFPNEKARGGNDLFMVGCTVSRDLKNVLSGEREMIDGYLHNAMNETVGFMNSNDFVLSDTNDIFKLHQSPSESYQINEILHQLRLDVDNLIKRKLDL